MSEKISQVEAEDLQTTTVWILPAERMEGEIRRNLLWRCIGPQGDFLEVRPGRNGNSGSLEAPLILIRGPEEWDEASFTGYRKAVREIAQKALCSHLAVEAKDFRKEDGELIPAALVLWEDLNFQKALTLKEIIIIVPEAIPPGPDDASLRIVHKYLLIYERQQR